MKRIILILILVFNAYYLTELLDIYTINSKLQYFLIFVYFLLLNFFIGNFTIKFFRKKNILINKWKVILTIIISLLIVGAGAEVIHSKNNKATLLTLTATGEKNVKSNSTEVWITNIRVDNKKIDLKHLNFKGKWDINEGALVSSRNQPSVLELQLPIANKIEVEFMKHDWSGVVIIKDSSYMEKLDLYSTQYSNYVYKVKGNQTNFSNFQKLLYFISSTLLFYSILFILFCLCEYDKKFICLLIIFFFWIIFGLTKTIEWNILVELVLLFIFILASMLLYKKKQVQVDIFLKNRIVIQILVAISSILISATIINYNTFVRFHHLTIVEAISKFILVAICLSIFIIMVVNFLLLLIQKLKNFNKS